MGRTHEPTLEEGHEGHNVPIGWCRRILTTKHEPLHRHGPHVEEPTPDKALHVQVGDVRAVPQNPWEARVEERELCR
jgi:hypothetical protein